MSIFVGLFQHELNVWPGLWRPGSVWMNLWSASVTQTSTREVFFLSRALSAWCRRSRSPCPVRASRVQHDDDVRSGSGRLSEPFALSFPVTLLSSVTLVFLHRPVFESTGSRTPEGTDLFRAFQIKVKRFKLIYKLSALSREQCK